MLKLRLGEHLTQPPRLCAFNVIIQEKKIFTGGFFYPLIAHVRKIEIFKLVNVVYTGQTVLSLGAACINAVFDSVRGAASVVKDHDVIGDIVISRCRDYRIEALLEYLGMVF